MTKPKEDASKDSNQVSNRIFTVPNAISTIRLCLVPVFFALLLSGYNIIAAILYALAACTDWIDGRIARQTNQVTKLGQILDPAVDRILMISGVLGLLFVKRLPLWIIIIVLFRDLVLIIGGGYFLKRYHIRVAVIYLGKVSTTLLFIGFAGLLLNWPLLPGLGIVDATWLPGLNSALYSWGIWFVYIGLVLAIITTTYYVTMTLQMFHGIRQEASESNFKE